MPASAVALPDSERADGHNGGRVGEIPTSFGFPSTATHSRTDRILCLDFSLHMIYKDGRCGELQ